MRSIIALMVSVGLGLTIPSWGNGPSLEKGFSDLVKKVGSGVVNISTFVKPVPQRGGAPGGGRGGNDEQFRRFFEEFFGRQMPNGPESPRGQPFGRQSGKPQPYSLGTGFIIDDSGLILTNYHVIGEAEEVKIQFKEEAEGELTEAEVIGRDPELDIALLKVKSKGKLTALPLGDSDKIDVGEYVLAIGNPMGYGHSVTHGILSAKERIAPELRLAKYLQTDASINPGNSGGPLINMRGEVIGINNAIDARAQGIGFAIPINQVKAVLPQLKSKGAVSRGYLGVSIGEITPDVADQLGIDSKTKGVLVVEVEPGKPAQSAGILPYDVIVSVNGEKVNTALDLTTKITQVPVGGVAEVALLRKGKERKLKVKVGERPTGLKPSGKQLPESLPKKQKRDSENLESLDQYGLQVAPLDSENAKEFGIPSDELKQKRLVVTELAYGKPATEAGISRGDLILDVAGKTVSTPTDLARELNGKSKSVMLRVRRYDPQGNPYVTVVIVNQGRN